MATQGIISVVLSMSSVFLIPIAPEYGAGYVLVDTGYDRDYGRFIKGLRAKGLAPGDLRAVFLTHHHDDHSGFLREIKRDSGCPIIMSRLTAELLLTGENDKSRGGYWVSRSIERLARLKAAFDKNWSLSFAPYRSAADDIVFDPDHGEGAGILKTWGIEAEAIPTPGHCIDHQVLVFPDGTAIVGDAAAAMLLWAGSRHFPVFMTDIEQAYRDWQRILDAGAIRILPSHGKPFPATVLEKEMGRVRPSDLAPFRGL